MAYFEMHVRSKVLEMQVTVNVILPEDTSSKGPAGAPEGTYKTLYLLHGLSDDHTAWMRNTSIARYARDHGIAVVMPAVVRSWYTDTAYGSKYFTFVAEELPRLCRSYFKGMSDKREDNFVAGLSMGGYGALKMALTYPERFGGCASLSGALDITYYHKYYDMNEWRGNFGFDITDGSTIKDSENDVFALARRNREQGKPFPKIYMWCGTDDSLIDDNRRYKALLEELSVDFAYDESEGDHSWKWWDMHIQPALKHILY